MVVDKVINNNLVRSHNDNKVEVLVMGCGLGFKKKPGDPIEDKLIEKVYSITDPKAGNQLEELLSSIPQEHIRIANTVIRYAKEHLEQEISNKIYISLTDHISYAIERAEQGVYLKNALLWEIQKYYSKEYEIGLKALEIVKEQLGVELIEDEAGYIALHITTAEINTTDTTQTIDTVKMIQNILQIVKYHFHRDLDESSVHYERFLTHLKFFAQRVIQDKAIESDDANFVKMIREAYQEEYKCACKVADYVKKDFGKELTDEETIYLAVHIKRVTMK